MIMPHDLVSLLFFFDMLKKLICTKDVAKENPPYLLAFYFDYIFFFFFSQIFPLFLSIVSIVFEDACTNSAYEFLSL